MFDYKLLAALAAVVEQGGFERAAQVLGLSQSAVSQRIKLLEARVGQPVLQRSSPPAAPACWPRATRGFPRRARPQWPRIARWAGSSAGRVPAAR